LLPTLRGLAALSLAWLAVPASANGDVFWSIGVTPAPGVVVGASNLPPPVYAPPRMVYTPPAMVYTPPRVVYSAPVYVVQPAPPHWHPPHPGHGHGHGHGRGHGHGKWDRHGHSGESGPSHNHGQ
jgi:hypothetical protein